MLRQTRRALAGDAVVEVSRSCYRADKYTLRVQLGSKPLTAHRVVATALGPASTSGGRYSVPQGRDGLAGLLADPHRVGAAEVGLDVERVLGARRS